MACEILNSLLLSKVGQMLLPGRGQT